MVVATGNTVEIHELTRRYHQIIALDRLNLCIPAGSVFGIVGINGAGKTTIIKHVLGLLVAQTGSVRVFGKDPIVDPVGVLTEIGYLSEENDIPEWLQISDVLRYVRAFYPNWDPKYADSLLQQFDIDTNKRIRDCSKGQKARIGLLTALAYRPKLLVLDEPSSGLDPIIRHDILSSIVHDVAGQGRTVLFSSHLLGEVEEVCDYVAILRDGKAVLCDKMTTIKEQFVSVKTRFATADATLSAVYDGVLGWLKEDEYWTVIFSGNSAQIDAVLAGNGAHVIERKPATLDQIFRAVYAPKPCLP